MSREYTTEEVQKAFLDRCRKTVDDWAEVEKDTCKEKISGAVFSILATLDGCDGDLPAFIVAPNPHPEDKEYLIGEGEDYYSENDPEAPKANISGGLHEAFYVRAPMDSDAEHRAGSKA